VYGEFIPNLLHGGVSSSLYTPKSFAPPRHRSEKFLPRSFSFHYHPKSIIIVLQRSIVAMTSGVLEEK
jgi:hypothetical protein